MRKATIGAAVAFLAGDWSPALATETVDCAPYVLVKADNDTAKGCGQRCVPEVKACFERLAADLLWLEQGGTAAGDWRLRFNDGLQRSEGGKRVAPADKAAYLQAAHDVYRRLKTWRKALERTPSKPEDVRMLMEPAKDQGATLTPFGELRSAEESVDERIHPLMRREAGFEPFFGALVTGPVIQDVGKKPDGSDTTTRATAMVAFESKHIGQEEGRRLHASLGGSFGYAPVFVMTVPDGSGPDVPATPSYLGGFVYDVGLNAGFNLGNLAELTLLGRYGQTRPSNAAVVDRPDPAQDYIAVPSDIGTGSSKDYFTAGVKAVVFRGQKLDAAHERGYLLPAATLEFGWRWDMRFRGDPRLSAYTAPEQRMYFAFRLNALRVFERSEKPRDLEVTFGFEREWARQTGGLPAGTKLVFAGTLNLLQLFGSNR